MNNALFTPLREGGWIPQEAFVYLWHKKIKVMDVIDWFNIIMVVTIVVMVTGIGYVVKDLIKK